MSEKCAGSDGFVDPTEVNADHGYCYECGSIQPVRSLVDDLTGLLAGTRLQPHQERTER